MGGHLGVIFRWPLSIPDMEIEFTCCPLSRISVVSGVASRSLGFEFHQGVRSVETLFQVGKSNQVHGEIAEHG